MSHLLRELEAYRRNMIKAGAPGAADLGAFDAPRTPEPARPDTPAPSAVPPPPAPQASPAPSAAPPPTAPQASPAVTPVSRPSAPATGGYTPPASRSTQVSSTPVAPAQTPAALTTSQAATGAETPAAPIEFDTTSVRPDVKGNLFADTDSKHAFALAKRDLRTQALTLTDLGKKVQKYAVVQDPSNPGARIQTSFGIVKGQPVLYQANSSQDAPIWPLYLWSPKRQDFIPYSQYITTALAQKDSYTFNDKLIPQYAPDGSLRFFHQYDADQRYPVMIPDSRSPFGYQTAQGWTQDATTGLVQFAPTGFTRVQIYNDKFQTIPPEMALLQKRMLGDVRAEVSKVPGASLAWNDRNGIDVVDGTDQIIGTVNALGVHWNPSTHVGKAPAQAPQDVWTVMQSLTDAKLVNPSTDILSPDGFGNITIYSPEGYEKYELSETGVMGGYALQSKTEDGGTVIPVTAKGELLTQDAVTDRLWASVRCTAGAYNPVKRTYPVLDSNGQQVGRFFPYSGWCYWDAPTETPAIQGPETAPEPKVDAPTLSNALQDPKVMEYLAYGIPIGAALGLAGYAIGGAKPGTLLPYLLGGAGGGALLGGLYGHYYGDGSTATGQMYDAGSNLSAPQRTAILEERLGQEGIDFTAPLTQEDIDTYSSTYVPTPDTLRYTDDELGEYSHLPDNVRKLQEDLSTSLPVSNTLQQELPFAYLCARGGGPVRYLGYSRTADGGHGLNYVVRNPDTGRSCILHAKYVTGYTNQPSSYTWKMETATGTYPISVEQADRLFIDSYKDSDPGRPFQPDIVSGDSDTMERWLDDLSKW